MERQRDLGSGDKAVYVRGLAADGLRDDAPALQRALDAGAGAVRVPPGRYRLGATLRIGSGTTLVAETGAHFFLADGAGVDREAFLLTNRNHGGAGDRDIAVIGGIWDGNAAHNPRGADGSPDAYTGTALNFVNVERLAIRSLTVSNPEGFYIRLGEARDFAVEDIAFASDTIRRNQDGIHLGGFCERGRIRRIRGITPDTPNDDMVAMNADDSIVRNLNLGMKRGPLRDIEVEDLECHSTWNFVRILSHEQPIERVAIRNVLGGCRYHAVNMDRWSFPPGKGDLRDIAICDWTVGKTDPANLRPLIPLQLGCRNVRIERFRRTDVGRSTAPTFVLDNGRNNRLRLAAPGEAAVDTICRQWTRPSGDIERLEVDTV